LARVPFRARARTVDHLGREQIADCPTAVSELWKNAYDAYAEAVALHIFDGEIPVAAVVDDGHGMSAEEFVERWLMLGTEAKAGEDEVPEEDRNGLPLRPRQGQKGIGRLSVAYLGPTALVLTKRRGGPFVAALLDWRLFQNPYLRLDDVQVPVEEFSETGELSQVVSRLFDGLVDNVWGGTDDPHRRQRLEAAWHRFSADEKARGEECSADRIAGLALGATLQDRHVSVWPVWTDARDHGTALFVFDAVHELRVWVDPGLPREDPEIKEIREKLRLTLTGFVDPFVQGDRGFAYQVVAHHGEHLHTIVSADEVFDLQSLRTLEHVVEGRFDAAGVFTGTVRAWGKELGEIPPVQPPRPPPPTGRGYVGAFAICFGTFEQEPKFSTHTPDVIVYLKAQAERFSGLAVYRDGLRVQPYGRPEADFFGMEERRGRHAGREFWAHRRTFGRVAISRSGNPHLRDKAGREGIIDNQGAREFRLLVVELLQTLARRYFGTDSELRTAETVETQARYARAQEAEQKARKRRTTALRQALNENGERLQMTLAAAQGALADLEGSTGQESLEAAAQRIDALRAERAALALPPRPRKLTPSLEERYLAYRDAYAEVTATLERAEACWTVRAEASRREPPAEAARSALGRHQKFITDAVSRWKRSIRDLLSKEAARWSEKADGDNSRYHTIAGPLLQDVAAGRLSLGTALSEMEAHRERVFGDLAREYEGYLRSLSALGEGIEIDDALGWAMDERADLLERVDQWQALAQLGITVEIIGHDLYENTEQVSRNLSRLPGNARQTEAYKLAMAGFLSLKHHLKFLAPLRLSGTNLRETITGESIEKYLREFFGKQITDRRVELMVTPAFRETTVVEYPHRIFPVFVNLVNNALYWVTFSTDRQIRLDRLGSKVYVADSGPGVDQDDIPELFQRIFFTRRLGGHGVGLYLSRISLEQGRHRIRYADPDETVLPGANFIIEFQNLQDD
jgi:signal transduction histidine kinase